MTQNLKIEVLTGDISIDGMVVTNLVTKEELSTAIVKKADLGTDGKIPTNQLPAEIVNTAGIVDEVKQQLETSIKDAIDESNAYAESYTDNALTSKADLVSGKVPLEQLPSIDQYPQFGTALSNLSSSILTSVKQRTDQLEKSKADLGEDGKLLREQIPSYEKISGLPERLEVMSTQTAAVSGELDEHKLQTSYQIDTLKENIEANVQQLTDRQSHLMRTYATKELGVDAKVGVKPGEYFNVRSSSYESYADEYQNVGGVPTPTGKTYPSSNAKWSADFVIDGDENQHDINSRTTRQIATISELKNYTPRKNDQIVEVIDYDANVQGVFNKYIYRASSNLDDNYGTVIASDVVGGRWIMLPKSEYIPEDFGVLSGEVAGSNNNVRFKDFLESGLNLQIPAKKYKMAGLLSVTISKPTRIVGQSMHSSILDNLKIVMDEGSQGSEFRNFRINTNSLNYSIYIVGGGYSVFDHLYFYHNYDGICTYTTTREVIGNVVSNCISEKSGRIGFTADFGAVGTTFINNTAIDCRQGFHFEGAKRTRLINSTTIGCGLDSSLSSSEQDSYAGTLRSYAVEGLFVDGFTNISPAGRCQWQHGGGGNANLTNSRDLVFKNFKDVGLLLLDDEYASTENVSFFNMNTFGIYAQGGKQKLLGNVVIENVTGSGDLMVGGATSLTISNATTGRLNIGADKIFLKDVRASTVYWHTISAIDLVSTGLLETIQTGLADPEWYHGFHFAMTNTVRMKIENIRFSGMGYGSHLVFTGLTSTTKEVDLGKLDVDVNMDININGTAYAGFDNLAKHNITYSGRKVYYTNTIPTTGNFLVGDVIRKTSVAADTIYGWVCTTAGTGTAAVWKPLKHDV